MYIYICEGWDNVLLVRFSGNNKSVIALYPCTCSCMESVFKIQACPFQAFNNTNTCRFDTHIYRQRAKFDEKVVPISLKLSLVKY